MMRRLWLALLPFIGLPAHADHWSFGEKIAVSGNIDGGVFQHLDSAGRKNIAVSGKTVAIVWEDNRSGAPQAYIALKKAQANTFSREWRISTGKSAFTPAILALGRGRFLAGWEQDGAVWLRTVSSSGPGPATKISRAEAGQIAFDTADGRNVVAAWSELAGRFTRIVTAAVKIGAGGEVIHASTPKPVDPNPPAEDQSYPSVAVTKEGAMVAWEDRRPGHTILLYSHAAADKPFGAPQQLNEAVRKSAQHGRGSGVTRVALAALGDGRIGAVWMDKRGYQTAYDIYAAFNRDNGARFGANEIVQDAFGEQYAQWHPAIAGDASGQVIVAWDDDRDGSSDIWLARKTADGWDTNISPPPASGDGQQTNPAIALDAQGNLHLVWVEQKTEDDPGRVMYAMGRYRRAPQPGDGAAK